ncbi:MAG: TlpA family protein disulfide reductase [Treponema sp.]|jgi:thiol-disulfide isomerase/thioredoxin|nr:TlpA family protein disulfide reductase [Treponema sp.]
MTRRVKFAAVLLFALLAACTVKAEKPARESAAAENGAVRAAFEKAGLTTRRELRELPGFTASLAADTRQINLSDYRGKVVFVNLWATWCGPCAAEMPSMEILYRRYKERGLEILAVNLREDAQTVTAFMNRYHLSFPALLDPDGKIGSRYGVQAIPTSFILDRRGRVVLHLVGSIDWNNAEIFEAFEALLAENP